MSQTKARSDAPQPPRPLRRWWLLLPLMVALLLGAFWGVGTLKPPCPVTRAAFEAIQPGMTLQDVEAVLGGPPGNYRTGEVDLDLSGGSPEFFNVMHAPEVLLGERHFRHEWWEGDEGNVWVCFDEEDRVVTKEFTPGRRLPPFPFDQVSAWLGW